MSEKLKRAALLYAELGIRIFPIAPRGKLPVISKKKGGHGFKDATTDTAKIEKWWKKYPDANIGLPCRMNDIVALDIDPRHNGYETFAKLEEKLGPLPKTVKAITGGDGEHRCFKAPKFRCKGGLGPGVDIKNDGYIVVAPSVHPNGNRYRWKEGQGPHETDIVELPEAWKEYLEKRQEKAAARTREESHYHAASGATTPYGQAALDAEYQELAGTLPGYRNNACNRASFVLAQLVAGGEIAEEDARQAIRQACQINGLLIDEPMITERTIESSFREGMKKPREAPPDKEATYSKQDLERDWARIVGEHGKPVGGGRIVIDEDSEEAEWEPLEVGETYPISMAELDRREREGFDPIPTGLPALDGKLGGGLPRGQTSVTGAPPGFGKTSLALSMMGDNARNGIPGIFWSLEIPTVDAFARIVTIEAPKYGEEVSWGDVRNGKHNDLARKVMNDHIGLPMCLLDQQQLPLTRIGQAVHSMADKYGTEPMLIIDYAQLLADPDRDREQRAAAERVADLLLSIAISTGCCVLALSSVGRGKYMADADPMSQLGIAKESGKFESDAAVVTGIVPTDMEDPRFKKGWIVIAKNRVGGATGKIGVEFDGLVGRFRAIRDEDVPGKGKFMSMPEMILKTKNIIRKHRITSLIQLSDCTNISHKKQREVVSSLVANKEMDPPRKGAPYRLTEGCEWESGSESDNKPDTPNDD